MGSTFYPDPAAMQLDDLPDDHKTEPGCGFARRRLCAQTAETLEGFFDVVVTHSLTGIAHFRHNPAILGMTSDRDEPAGIRKFDGIADQIVHHFPGS